MAVWRVDNLRLTQVDAGRLSDRFDLCGRTDEYRSNQSFFAGFNGSLERCFLARMGDRSRDGLKARASRLKIFVFTSSSVHASLILPSGIRNADPVSLSKSVSRIAIPTPYNMG